MADGSSAAYSAEFLTSWWVPLLSALGRREAGCRAGRVTAVADEGLERGCHHSPRLGRAPEQDSDPRGKLEASHRVDAERAFRFNSTRRRRQPFSLAFGRGTAASEGSALLGKEHEADVDIGAHTIGSRAHAASYSRRTPGRGVGPVVDASMSVPTSGRRRRQSGSRQRR